MWSECDECGVSECGECEVSQNGEFGVSECEVSMCMFVSTVCLFISVRVSLGRSTQTIFL